MQHHASENKDSHDCNPTVAIIRENLMCGFVFGSPTVLLSCINFEGDKVVPQLQSQSYLWVKWALWTGKSNRRPPDSQCQANVCESWAISLTKPQQPGPWGALNWITGGGKGSPSGSIEAFTSHQLAHLVLVSEPSSQSPVFLYHSGTCGPTTTSFLVPHCWAGWTSAREAL